MPDFEKLGLFYLGRPYDLERRQPRPGYTLYDSRDLVTHAVCVGMTGSGKTGLCLCLLEEAAIDGVPAIVIDPKGDLGNLLLTFPDLRPEDFAPWIDEDDARRQELSTAAFAASQAELWTKGLAAWEQDGARIRRLREAADFAIYTPGSEAGLPISVLRSFAAPDAAVKDDTELVRERATTTVSSLLGLVGIAADPIRSREHILLSTLILDAWRQGRDLDLGELIQQIQTPPVARVGVLDLETFYPEKARFELAMAINNLLAAPGFGLWLEGEALDIGRLLYTPEGKPRVSIFSIAHLGDAERMFFVSLLLSQTVGWMRAQTGTTSLRAILYMDEIAGYLPPVANPPSKPPMLTLLKQARAFGLGVVLATQNPVDLDYKALANAGTWFLGRLQTERDKARVIEGLEGAAATTGQAFDRAAVEATLASLGQRVFLMNNVHDERPEVFETRWALSYLRGPLARPEVKRLMDPRRASAAAAPAASERQAQPKTAPAPRATQPRPEPAPASGEQLYAPVRAPAPAAATLVYAPMVLATATVRYTEPKLKLDVAHEVGALAPIAGETAAVDWTTAVEPGWGLSDLGRAPAAAATLDPLPKAATRVKTADTWRRAFASWIYTARRLDLWRCEPLAIVSDPGEREGDFRARLQIALRERRDAAIDALRQKYAPKLAALNERLARAQQATAREREQATLQQVDTAISLGATVLGALFGRKAVSRSTIGGASRTARGVSRSMKQADDAARAGDTLSATQAQIQALEAQLQQEMTVLESGSAVQLDPISVAPKKTQIAVQAIALVWVPHWQDNAGNRSQA